MSEFQRAQQIEFMPGVVARCASAENVVIRKLPWYVLGNRVSDRQWNDIVQVLEVQKGNLDEQYLETWASYFGLTELLAVARSQTF